MNWFDALFEKKVAPIVVIVVVIATPGVVWLLSSLLSPPAPPRVSRARSDMRSLDTALQAYRIDHGAYPLILTQLTTPIAYITRVFEDYYVTPTRAQQRATDYETWAQMHYRMRMIGDGEGLLLWSVGPDGVDDRGLILYDPTNGADSRGDLIRVVATDDDWTPRMDQLLRGEAVE